MVYYEAASVLETIDKKKGTVKSLCLSASYKNKKELYAVVCETLKYLPFIKQILEYSQFLEQERVLQGNQYIAQILLHDFLFNKHGVKKQCPRKYKDALARNSSALKSALVRIKVKAKVSSNEDLLQNKNTYKLPRYVRVNRLKTTVAEVIAAFQKDGYELLPKPDSHESFLSVVERLGKKQFVEDVFVEDLLVFSKTDFHANSLYNDGRIILQDKASCVPAFALQPRPGAHVMDACAAPGNKTSQACAYMQNKGKMHAFDIDGRRLATMKTLLTKAGVTCARLHKQDFLKVQPHEYKTVEYAIVDPSCSGSGIVSRLGGVTDDEASYSSERLSGLAAFQASVVEHALSFPAVKRLMYSTCSIHEEENEQVVLRVLEACRDRFHLSPVLPSWPSRGLTRVFPEAYKCLRLSPETDRTNGFFVACFERNGWKEDAVKPDTPMEQEEELDHPVIEEETQSEEGPASDSNKTNSKKRKMEGENRIEKSQQMDSKKAKRKHKDRILDTANCNGGNSSRGESGQNVTDRTVSNKKKKRKKGKKTPITA